MATESRRRHKHSLAASGAPDERAADIERELEDWRAHAMPDASAPLDAEDVARLVRGCFDALGLDPALGESFSVHTVHYYRRKEILDAPQGRTSAARYALRHVWQAAGARLAGQLGLLTLAEAHRLMRGADDASLLRFVASRVADARGRQASRHAPPPAARPLRATPIVVPAAQPTAASLREGEQLTAYGRESGVAETKLVALGQPSAFTYPPLGATKAVVVALDKSALCLIPEGHAALRSKSAARALIETLADALGLTLDT
jgi:hypothetical protein